MYVFFIVHIYVKNSKIFYPKIREFKIQWIEIIVMMTKYQ